MEHMTRLDDFVVNTDTEDFLNWSEEGQEYSKAVKALLKEKTFTVFPNVGSEQAAIVMSYLYDNSEKTMRIFSNSFSGAYSNHSIYLRSLDNFLLEKKTIYVLLDNEPSDKSIAFEKILSYINDNPEKGYIKVVDPNYKTILSNKFADNKMLYFAVGDENKYRLEIDNITKESFSSFDHKKVAKQLISIFDVGVQYSHQIQALTN